MDRARPAYAVEPATALRAGERERRVHVASRPRLLIVTGNLALLRGHYQDVIMGLARAGVDVRIRYIKENLLDPDEFQEVFRAAGLDVSVVGLERHKRTRAELLAVRLRELGNILRFSHPDYEGRTVLSERALLKTGPGVRRWGRRLRRLGMRRSSMLGRLAGWIEWTLPPSPFAVSVVEAERPDAVAVVAVIRVPALVDFLKAATKALVPTAIWVQSWDNLTNKGLLHFKPDRVFVWNTQQVEELARYHGIPAEHACATGAQTFDHWFDGTPVPDREEFCARLGVAAEEPIILYLASSKQIAPHEPAFFARWLEALRASDDPALRTATVLARPHPTVVDSWHARGFEGERGVVLSPSTLNDQINTDPFRDRYRAELYHATVVVGINTSGLIDAAIFGKPACTVELPELFHGQRGTVHFQHLARLDGGLIRTAPSLEDHLRTLSELVRRDTYAHDQRSMDFVRSFVRPRGLDVRPGDVFVDEMVKLCNDASQIAPPRGVPRMLGAVLAGVAGLIGAPLEERPIKSAARRFLRAGSRPTRRLLWRGRLAASSATPNRKRLRKRLRKRSRALAYAIARRILPRPVRRFLRRGVFPRRDAGVQPGAGVDSKSVGS